MEYIFNTDVLPEAEELRSLFLQTSWAKDRSFEGVKILIQSTDIFVVVRDSGTKKLIGFGRALSDGVYRALLDDVVIAINYRKKGLGKQIVQKLLNQLETTEQVFLNTKPELEEFYKQFGFTKTKAFTMDR